MFENPAFDPQLAQSLPDDVRRRHDVAREFLQTLDTMRVRPTRKTGDVPLPVLHIAGTSEAVYDVVGALEERFKDGPFALVTVSAADDGLDFVGQAPYAPLAAQLREMADSFASTAPRGEAHLRFPLLNQLLWLLDLELQPSDTTKTLKRHVEREVRNRRFGIGSRERQGWASFLANFRAYIEGPFPAYAAGATAISVIWGAWLTTLLGVLAIVGILAFGAAHVAVLSGNWAGSHRYRWFCRQPYMTRRKRGRRPRTFSEFALVFMEARRQVELTVAADQPAARRAWQERLAKDRTLGSRRHLRIEIDIQDAESLQKATVPVTRRRTPLLARPTVPLLVVTALVLTALSSVVVRTSGYCVPGVHRKDTNECVGITDGSFFFHDRLKSIVAQIRKTNHDIEGSGRPYSTVIYVSQLSLPRGEDAGGDDLLAAVQGALAGIALRQKELFEIGKDGAMLQMRVLVANAGGQYRFAEDVADDILKKFNEDETIIAVVGFDESRNSVKRAIDKLQKQGHTVDNHRRHLRRAWLVRRRLRAITVPHGPYEQRTGSIRGTLGGRRRT